MNVPGMLESVRSIGLPENDGDECWASLLGRGHSRRDGVETYLAVPYGTTTDLPDETSSTPNGSLPFEMMSHRSHRYYTARSHREARQSLDLSPSPRPTLHNGTQAIISNARSLSPSPYCRPSVPCLNQLLFCALRISRPHIVFPRLGDDEASSGKPSLARLIGRPFPSRVSVSRAILPASRIYPTNLRAS